MRSATTSAVILMRVSETLKYNYVHYVLLIQQFPGGLRLLRLKIFHQLAGSPLCAIVPEMGPSFSLRVRRYSVHTATSF